MNCFEEFGRLDAEQRLLKTYLKKQPRLYLGCIEGMEQFNRLRPVELRVELIQSLKIKVLNKCKKEIKLGYIYPVNVVGIEG